MRKRQTKHDILHKFKAMPLFVNLLFEYSQLCDDELEKEQKYVQA